MEARGSAEQLTLTSCAAYHHRLDAHTLTPTSPLLHMTVQVHELEVRVEELGEALRDEDTALDDEMVEASERLREPELRLSELCVRSLNVLTMAGKALAKGLESYKVRPDVLEWRMRRTSRSRHVREMIDAGPPGALVDCVIRADFDGASAAAQAHGAPNARTTPSSSPTCGWRWSFCSSGGTPRRGTDAPPAWAIRSRGRTTPAAQRCARA